MRQTAVTAQVLDLEAGERNLIGLARVSTDHQDAQLQRDALTEAGCERVFEEKISTRKAADERSGLHAALDYVRPGDTLIVWRLDRLGRSVKEVLTVADDCTTRASASRSSPASCPAATSPNGEGKFFFTMMAALAELERDIIHERTMAGLVAARPGARGGRPNGWTRTSSPQPGPARFAAKRPRRSPGHSASGASVYRHLAADSE